MGDEVWSLESEVVGANENYPNLREKAPKIPGRERPAYILPSESP
jgi:hypothetical protein